MKTWLARRMGVVASVLVCGFCFAADGYAQSLGDVARQEREKRRQRCVSRVLTNEDLSRTEILSEEDRACLESAREAPATDAAAAAAPFAGNSAVRPVAGAAPPAYVVAPPFHLDSLLFPYESALPDFPLAEIAPYDREMKAARLEREAQLQKTVVARVPAGRSRLHAAAPAPGIAPSIPQFRLHAVSLETRLPPVPFAPAPSSDSTPAIPHRGERVAPVRIVVPAADSPTDSVEPSTVRVERGDSLWKIAARHLGDGRAWRRIAATNPQVADPNLIRVGDVLQLPGETSITGSESGFEESAAAESARVRVERGDTLWALARAQFGRGSAWTCIAQVNQLDNPNLILPGQTLTLPQSCPANN